MLRVEVETVTPLLVPHKVGYRGFLYKTLRDWIPGSVLRGALLFHMVREGWISKSEAVEAEGSYSVTPLLHSGPEASLYKDVAPAHALTYRFKCPGPPGREGVVLSPGVGKLLARVREDKRLEDAVEGLLSDFFREAQVLAREKRALCYSPANLEPYRGVVVRAGDVWRAGDEVRTTYYAETRISSLTGGAEPGGLYAYEGVAEGQVYTGYVSWDEGSPLSGVLSRLAGEALRLRLGRGSWRGFGLVEARFHEDDLTPRDLRLDLGEARGLVALEAVGPTFLLEGPGPRPPAAGDVIKAGGARLRVLGALGAGLITYSGWSYKTNTPKLPVEALGPGGLVVAEVEEGGPEDIARLATRGFNEHSSQGFNILLPMTKDYVPGLGALAR